MSITPDKKWSGKELEEIVDEDIKEFEVFFKSLGNSSLADPEKAAIKTYLWHKLHPKD